MTDNTQLVKIVSIMRSGGYSYSPVSKAAKIIAFVRGYYGYKDSDVTMLGSAHEADIRADERQRCIDAAESVHNPCQAVSTPAFLRIRNDIIKAIREAQE